MIRIGDEIDGLRITGITFRNSQTGEILSTLIRSPDLAIIPKTQDYPLSIFAEVRYHLRATGEDLSEPIITTIEASNV